MGGTMSDAFNVYIIDGNTNTINFPDGSYSLGSISQRCTDIVGGPKTTADIQNVQIQAYDNDGGLFTKLEISYDGGEAVTYGMGDPRGFWIDGDGCPTTNNGGVTDDVGRPCCSNSNRCSLQPTTFNLRSADVVVGRAAQGSPDE